jgi:hypothetical protein
MARKPSKAVYISRELNNLLDSLDLDHKFNKWIDNMKISLKENMLKGNKIRKSQIPDYYVESYEVNNLFHYRHPEGYRSCYTLHNFDELGVCPVILDIMTHSEYEKRFGYKM